MASKTASSVPVNTDTDPAPAPVGFTKTDVSRLANDTSALVAMWATVNAEKGDARARGQTRVRTLCACVLGDVERNPELSKTARGVRVAVRIKSRLRGEETVATVSLPILDILRALTFGGMVQGGGRIA